MPDNRGLSLQHPSIPMTKWQKSTAFNLNQGVEWQIFRAPGQYQSSTEPSYIPAPRSPAWVLCKNFHAPFTGETLRYFPKQRPYVPCKVSGTHLHSAECSASIFQSLQTLQREKTYASPWFPLRAPAVLLRDHKARKWLEALLQLCPKLLSQCFCFSALGLGPVFYTPQTPASTPSFEVPDLQNSEDAPPPDTGPYLEIWIFSVTHRKENVFGITETSSARVVLEFCSLPAVCTHSDEELESSRVSWGDWGSGGLFKCLWVGGWCDSWILGTVSSYFPLWVTQQGGEYFQSDLKEKPQINARIW